MEEPYCNLTISTTEPHLNFSGQRPVHIYPPLPIGRYAFIQPTELEQWVTRLAHSLTWQHRIWTWCHGPRFDWAQIRLQIWVHATPKNFWNIFMYSIHRINDFARLKHVFYAVNSLALEIVFWPQWPVNYALSICVNSLIPLRTCHCI